MSSSPLALDSLRLQLEGRWTHLEQARARETSLLRWLGSWRWRQHQAEWLPLSSEARAHEPELQAVLAYIEERASREQWPHDHPGRTALGELRARRATLVKRIHQRLAPSTPRDDVPFTPLLEHLESWALEPEPPPPSPEEFVFAQGWALSGARPGRYWLMAQRLLWKPWGGAPVQVKQTSPGEASWRWGLTFPRHTRALETLRSAQQELLHAPSSRLGDEEVVVCPASLHAEDFPNEPRWGMAVFHARHVTFIPTHRPAPGEHLRRWLSKASPPPQASRLLWQQALLERLRRLSPARFSDAVSALCQLRAGQHWPGVALSPARRTRDALEFHHRGHVLSLPRDRQPDALQPFLERHFPRAPEKPRGRFTWPAWMRPRWRSSLLWYRGLMVLGCILYSAPLQRWFSTHVPLLAGRGALGAGYLVLAWMYMRYAKAWGKSPVWGIAGASLGLTGAMIVFFRSLPKSSDSG